MSSATIRITLGRFDITISLSCKETRRSRVHFPREDRDQAFNMFCDMYGLMYGLMYGILGGILGGVLTFLFIFQ